MFIQRIDARQMMDAGLQQAIRAAGSERKLARLLGLSQQAVNKWETVPINRVLAVESVTGVPREVLRPDFFQRSNGEAV